MSVVALMSANCMAQSAGGQAETIAYPITQAERAAGVTPTDLRFPPDDVGMLERYGAAGNGSADDTAAIQAAIAVAKQGAQTIYLTQGKSYRFRQTIRISHEGKFRNIVASQIAAKSPFAISPRLIYDGPAGTYAIEGDGKGTSHVLLQGFNLTFANKRSRNGINFDSVAHSTIRGIHVFEANIALRTARTWNTRIVDSHFTHNQVGWAVDRALNATTVVNTRFNRNDDVGIRINAGVRGLLVSGGSVDNNGIGVSHAGRHVNWIKFDGTYLENNRIAVSHSGSASTSNWIWSAYFQNRVRSELWYEVKTSGKLVVSFRDSTIEGQPRAGKKRLISYESGEFRALMDNLTLENGATFAGSGDDWKRNLRFRGHYKSDAHRDIAIRPALQSGWTNADASDPILYWRDAEGRLCITGRVRGSGSGTVFLLNQGFRPEAIVDVPVITMPNAGERQVGAVSILPTGAVQLAAGSGDVVVFDVSVDP